MLLMMINDCENLPDAGCCPLLDTCYAMRRRTMHCYVHNPHDVAPAFIHPQSRAAPCTEPSIAPREVAGAHVRPLNDSESIDLDGSARPKHFLCTSG